MLSKKVLTKSKIRENDKEKQGMEIVRINDLENAEQLLLDHNREIGRTLTDAELTAGVRKFLANGEVLGYVRDGHIIGMLNLYCNNYETLEAYICNVYILEGFRGHHYARNLVSRAIEICKQKKFKSVRLHVAENNIPAVTVYENLGFSFTGEYKESDAEMRLPLY